MYRKKRSNIIPLFLFVAVIALFIFLYNSSMFERTPPKVVIQNNTGFWNLKSTKKLILEDQSGIKSYKVTFKSSKIEKTIKSDMFITPKTKVEIDIKPPRSTYAIKDKDVKIIIEAVDASKWNFFNGNSVKKVFDFEVDKKRPYVTVLANSYKINHGGCALVIFKLKEENLKDVYIKTSFGKKFKVTPYKKEGNYISLLAWPVKEQHFRADIIATDLAGNKTKTYIPLYLKTKHYRASKINISDRFLNGKIEELSQNYDETQNTDDKLEKFKIINETIREKNEKLIHDITSKVPEEMIYNFKVNKMYPLKNAKVVGNFGDHRFYYYNGQKISESWHLGLDLARYENAKIRPQNGGEVVFADFNGLYGNMPIIYHGLGLYTLYGHCSTLYVNQGDETTPKQVIAKTGKTGYAMGDHLHFGVLVQGIEVRPQEWMDKKWIKLNIYNVIKTANKLID